MVVFPTIPKYAVNSPRRRLYDERKPLEPLYSTVPISKTGSTYASEDTEDAERRIHAPPGQVQMFEHCVYSMTDRT